MLDASATCILHHHNSRYHLHALLCGIHFMHLITSKVLYDAVVPKAILCDGLSLPVVIQLTDLKKHATPSCSCRSHQVALFSPKSSIGTVTRCIMPQTRRFPSNTAVSSRLLRWLLAFESFHSVRQSSIIPQSSVHRFLQDIFFLGFLRLYT